MEDISLQIHKTTQSNKSTLALEGTVLVFNEKNKVIESETQIPVELVTIREGKKFRGSQLIIGLLFPLITLLAPLIIGAFIFDFLGVSRDSIYFNVFMLVSYSAFFLSIIICCIYIVRFFFRVNTISLVISPNGYTIELWKNKKDSQKIDELLEQIKQRQAVVEKTFEYPATNSIYTSKYSPILKIICILFLFTIPALITEIPFLFLLVLLPVIWFANKGILYLKHPKEYRQAMRLYIRRNWNEAISLLEYLKEKCPDYLPAYQLLVSIHLQTRQFDNALSVAASLPSEYQDLSQDIQTGIWYFKRLYERRKIK